MGSAWYKMKGILNAYNLENVSVPLGRAIEGQKAEMWLNMKKYSIFFV